MCVFVCSGQCAVSFVFEDDKNPPTIVATEKRAVTYTMAFLHIQSVHNKPEGTCGSFFNWISAPPVIALLLCKTVYRMQAQKKHKKRVGHIPKSFTGLMAPCPKRMPAKHKPPPVSPGFDLSVNVNVFLSLSLTWCCAVSNSRSAANGIIELKNYKLSFLCRTGAR